MEHDESADLDRDGERDDRNHFNDIETQLFNDIDSALHAINERAQAHGFAVIRRRPSNRDRLTGEYCRYDLECVRGHAKPSRGQGRRNKNHTRSNCPWLAKLVFSKKAGAWIFTLRQSRHTHDRDHLPAHIPAHRRRHRTGALEQALLQLVVQPTVTCADIVEQLQHEHPGLVLHPQDVLNAKAKQRKAAAATEGRTPTQQSLAERQVQDPLPVHQNNNNDIQALPVTPTSTRRDRSHHEPSHQRRASTGLCARGGGGLTS
ncbi:hypothetical protein V1525DRAFT_422088 [Lipomyces kononenkoae]|uniref:Uncharacterized protein n=1 Tax=Lipomyces kononenkoae TaxID=34357 RepID=A0ACC3SU18_LIPKO